MATVTLYPSSYDTEHHNWYSISNVANGYTSSSSSTYARIVNGGSRAEAYIYYKFDTSSIPDGSTIDSVACTFKCTMNGNSTTTPQKYIQLFTGTTAKGTAINGNTSTSARSIEDCGSWTLSEIRDIRIRAYTKSGSTTSRYNIDFYGATLTINYTPPTPSFPVRVKSNGSWADATKVLVKSSGSWVEASKVLVKDNGTWK